MQASVDGYFILPLTIGNYLSGDLKTGTISTDLPEFAQAEETVRESLLKLLGGKGTETINSLHRKLGAIMWKECAMSRNKKGLEEAIAKIKELRREFYSQVSVSGELNSMNTELDKAARFVDFLEMAELMCLDALQRDESCGAHFREEHQSSDGEALRNDDQFSYVSAWEHKADGDFVLHKEELKFEFVKPTVRSYK